MGIVAILRTGEGEQVRAFDDPNGGSFDAAGDFDELLDGVDDTYGVMQLVDLYGGATFDATYMPQLLADIERLAAQATSPRARRGLARLQSLAERCRDEPGLHLRFIGD
jgi:hypothetical protein